MIDIISELPADLRARIAIPRIVRGLLEFASEDNLAWDQIRKIGALDLGSWTTSLA